MDMRTDLISKVGGHQFRKRRHILEGVALTVTAVAVWFNDSYIEKTPWEGYISLRKHIFRHLFYRSEANCYVQLRFTKQAFHKFVKILREKGGLSDTTHVTVEESLPMFLHVIAHNLKFRVIKVIYIRSTETISRHFSMLLNGILRLADDYIKVPDSTTDVGTEDKWRWFKVSNISSNLVGYVEKLGRTILLACKWSLFNAFVLILRTVMEL